MHVCECVWGHYLSVHLANCIFPRFQQQIVIVSVIKLQIQSKSRVSSSINLLLRSSKLNNFASSSNEKDLAMEGDGVETQGQTIRLNGIKVENNGIFAIKDGELRSGEHPEIGTFTESNGKEIGIGEPVGTHSKSIGSPSGVSEVSPSAASDGSPSGASEGSTSSTKGYGLKRWRRRKIRRDFTNDGDNSVDFNRILKRGLPNVAEPAKPQDPFGEIVPKSESFNSPESSLLKSPGASGAFAIKSSNSDSMLAAGSAFPVFTDSENSEDKSSKSSTAASAPKMRSNMPAVMGSVQDKNKVKNPSGKNSSTVQRAQQGKGKIETSKKPRGERVKIEKESSYSSVDFSEFGNGSQGRSLDYDGENSNGSQGRPPQSNNKVQADYAKENGGEVEDVSQEDVAVDVSWDAKEEESEYHQLSTDRNPLLESIISLQTVQEVLEKEIQNFGEIGKEPISLHEDSICRLNLHAELAFIDSNILESNSLGQLCFEESKQNCSLSLEDQLIKLNQKVEEASAILKAKEFRIDELEAILNRSTFPKEESRNTLQSLEEKCREFEIEMEGLFKQKIEAEIKYLVIIKATQNWNVAADNQVALYGEQKSLEGEKIQMLKKLRDSENKSAVLKREGKELEASSGELLGTEEIFMIQNRVCKFTLCFFVQLILLCVVFGLFLLQFLPHSTVVVPT